VLATCDRGSGADRDIAQDGSVVGSTVFVTDNPRRYFPAVVNRNRDDEPLAALVDRLTFLGSPKKAGGSAVNLSALPQEIQPTVPSHL
jgi:hypothetical protein